jgi:general secretion pathway protein G
VRARGFTLIELLVVLAVIAVLLTVAVPRYFSGEDRAKENLYQMREAIQQYYADKGKYPEQLEALATEKYLRTIPLDPVTERADTWVVVPPQDAAAGGVYDVRSGAAGAGRDGKPFSEL